MLASPNNLVIHRTLLSVKGSNALPVPPRLIGVGNTGWKSFDRSFPFMNQSSLAKAIETARLLFVSRDSVLVRAIWSMGES